MNTLAMILLWWVFLEQILGILLDAAGKKVVYTWNASSIDRIIGVIVHGVFLFFTAKALGLI